MCVERVEQGTQDTTRHGCSDDEGWREDRFRFRGRFWEV